MLAILTTHPIQYQVPLWQALARDGRVPFEVWYLTRHGTRSSHDPGFGQSFSWDLDLLSGYPHRFLDSVPGATPNTFWRCQAKESLVERMRSAGVKAIWIQGWQVAGYWQAAWTATKAGAEVWLRGESNDIAPISVWKRAIKRLVLGRLFQRIDRFLYIGSANRRLYEKFGVAKTRLYPTPYAVDNKRFENQAAAIRDLRSEIRREWGIAPDAFCVLFCGKFIPKKRPLDLVKAAQSLISSNRLPNIHLLFVGSGELGAELRQSCNVAFDQEADDLTSDLRPPTSDEKPPASFAGFLNQTEISRAYVAADCLVLPSDHGETWGLVVNEAMASGLPCIISDQCGCSVDLGVSTHNRVFSCGNVDAVSDAIVSVADEQPKVGNSDISLPSFQQTVETVAHLYAERSMP
ncbi:MAG: hypothetical protein QOF24_423 [Verrucomicrobiota bacterium]|jgi:glycosyltransferase involved in cell wall biosynthesis